MAERSHLSIGEVLSLLRDEFPDVTISKIRFLESQGLVDPERTPSGYRKFYEHDVERLRWILQQQREKFLPLKVIRGQLNEHDFTPTGLGSHPGEHGTGSGATSVAGHSVAGQLPFGNQAEHEPTEHEPTEHDPAPPRPAGYPVPARQPETTEAPGLVPPHPGPPRQPGQPADHSPGADPAEIGSGTSRAPAAKVQPDALGVSEPTAAAGLPAAASTSVPAGRAGGSGRVGEGETGADARKVDEAATRLSVSEPVPSVSEPGPDGLSPSDRRPAPEPPTLPVASPDGAGSRDDAQASGPGLPGAGHTTSPPPDERATAQRPAGTTRAERSATARPRPVEAERGGSDETDESLTIEELARATGLEPDGVRELEQFGLLHGRMVGRTSYYDRDALAVTRVAAAFARHGIEARHLRAYRNSVEREAGLFEAVVLPLVRQRNPASRRAAAQTIDELCSLGAELRALLIRQTLSDLH